MKLNRKLKFAIPVLLTIILSCSRADKNVAELAFYYWKTTFDITDDEFSYLEDVNCKKLYVRFFDVDFNMASGETVPLGIIENKIGFPDNFEIIPTVYLTNRTFMNTDSSGLKSLSNKILEKIRYICSGRKIYEIQMDCDWSEKTRISYFNFLKYMRSGLSADKTILSATIRLHQVKYFERTGVPPVDKGMLMYYNMGKISDSETANSILSTTDAEKYMFNFEKYPMKLDVALPLFSWGVVIRKTRPVKLIHNLRQEDVANNELYEEFGDNIIKVRKSHYLGGEYLYNNDLIRIESVNYKELLKATKLLCNNLPAESRVVSFFHLDEKNIKYFDHEKIQTICSLFD